MLHPKQDRILAFASGLADTEEAERMFTHLAECEACTQRYQAIRSIREDFEGSWDGFLAEVRHRMETKPAPAAVRPTILGLAVRGIVNRARQVATVAVNRVTEAIEPGGDVQGVFAPAYRGVADAAVTPSVKEATEDASRLCGEGDDEKAMRRLHDAAGEDPETASSATLNLQSRDEVIGKVIVDATRGSVSLLIQPDALETSRGIAVLEPAAAGALERRAPLEEVEGADYFLAEFETVPDGAFHLRLELE